MKRRVLVEVLSALKNTDTSPTVWIDNTKGQEVTFGVRTSAPSLKLARQRAVEEFKQLQKDVEALKDEKLLGDLGHR